MGVRQTAEFKNAKEAYLNAESDLKRARQSIVGTDMYESHNIQRYIDARDKRDRALIVLGKLTENIRT